MEKIFAFIHRIGAITCALIAVGLILTSFVGAFIKPGRYDHCFYMGAVYGIIAWICASNAKESAKLAEKNALIEPKKAEE